MVHALREARRVLKPDGLLIDLRPAIQHCRVGILRAGRFRPLGVAYGSLEGQRAANRAISHILAERILRQVARDHFECDVVFSSPGALREWLTDFNESEAGPAEERLVQHAAEASRRGRGILAVRIALVMKQLRK